MHSREVLVKQYGRQLHSILELRVGYLFYIRELAEAPIQTQLLCIANSEFFVSFLIESHTPLAAFQGHPSLQLHVNLLLWKGLLKHWF